MSGSGNKGITSVPGTPLHPEQLAYLWGQHLRFDFNLGVTPQRLVRVVSHFIAGLFGGPVPAPEWEPSERSVGLCEGGLE